MPVAPQATPNAPPTAGPYSPAVRAGDWLICSGQVGFDANAGAMADGVDAQTRHAMANIGVVLGDCGAAVADIAKTTIFVVDLADFATVNAAYGEALGDHRPARSTVQVAALPFGALVEIEVWAYLGS